MPTRKHQALPRPLGYLQPFVEALAKFHPDDVNEDVDPALLEKLVRQRIDGQNLQAARAAINADRKRLETWLRGLGDRTHPAYWILGFLSAPDVVGRLRASPEPVRPEISFVAPPGWRSAVDQNGLSLKKRKLIGQITVIDESSHQLRMRQMQFVPSMLPRGHELCSQTVEFGACSGTKILVDQPFKRVDYLLRVPGGYVAIMLTGMGAAFDETEFEAHLHTLQVSGAPTSTSTL